MPAEPGRTVRVSLIGGAVAVPLGLALVLGPPVGTDLSAQVARADFIQEYGLAPVDLRWYGGTVQYGYSWWTPALMVALGGGLTGARLAGTLALVASTAGLAVLLSRARVPRPALGVVLGGLAFAGNLISGRVTFAIGIACALWALAALTAERGWIRYGGAAGGAVLAAAASPVAGLFVTLAGVALALSGASAGGAVLAGAAAVPLAVTAVLFAEGGTMNISAWDAIRAIGTGLVVAALVPVRAVRIGALLAGAGVLVAYLLDTPVGLNATRLATVFALPVVAACATAPRWLPTRSPIALRVALPTVLVALALWQPPVLVGDLADAGNPTASRSYFAPLLDELARRRPVGRVEVPPTRDYWESAYVAERVPLARGWLRQLDMARNPLFFDGRLNPVSYEAWLRDTGVSHVALPDARLSWVGAPEAALVRGGLPFLSPVWRDPHWTLYEVAGTPSIVEGGVLVSVTGAAVTFDAAVAGEVLVRVAPSRWLRVVGPAPASIGRRGRWIVVTVDRPGRYTVTSS